MELTRQTLIKQSRAFETKKRLGQHFLIEPEVLESIADSLAMSDGDDVLEIGPGIGFLSRFLVAGGGKVTAVELDAGCIKDLQRLQLPNLQVVHGDFLQSDLNKLFPGDGPIKVAGNVPYQITSKILGHLFGEIGEPSPWLHRLQVIVLTVQLEVAQRFVAPPGGKDYSQITLLSNYFSKASIVQTVSADNFYPPPEVTSAVVKFLPQATPSVICSNHKLLRQLIRAGFGQRRKMLKNNLGFLNLSGKALNQVWDRLNLDPQVRAERLSLAQFALLTDACNEELRDSKMQVENV